MTNLLPKPQELRVAATRLQATAVRSGFMAPWAGDDALLECLAPCWARLTGGTLAVAERALPGKPGCTLVLAADEATAERLARAAVEQMSQPIVNFRAPLDGGVMSEPFDGMGKIEAPAEGIAALPESYVLHIVTEGVAIAGTDRAGLFYGVQTLLQVLEGETGSLPCLAVRDFPSQRVRGIHVDMKYAFWQPQTLDAFLRQMARLKLNTALFEYEDKFPYRRHPVIVDAVSALTPEQLAGLVRTARRHHVTIVPLVQTLAHLEFALKHDALAPLREIPDSAYMVCPRKPEAVRFVKDMIDEVCAAHPDAPIICVGGDETVFLGRCPTCRAIAAERGRVGLYVDHYVDICSHVLAKGRRPMLWDDIVRTYPVEADRLPRATILAYWIYETVRERHGARAIPEQLETLYDCAGRRPPELPDTLSTYPLFDCYRQKGFDVIAVPCYNAGALMPCFEVTTRNTSTWAEKVDVCGGLGLINSCWASFMIHPDAGWYGVAQTADNTWWWPSINRLDFDVRLGEVLFGVCTPEIGECFAALAAGVGMPSPLKRPLSLLCYSYMENVIHFEGNMEARSKGSGRINGPMDVHNHLVRKLELVEQEGYAGEVRRQLDMVENVAASACRRLRALRPKATRNEATLDLLICIGEFKVMRCRHWRFFLEAFARRARPVSRPMQARAARCLREEDALGTRFRALHAAKLCPPDTDFVVGRMFDGERRLLRELAAGKSIQPSYRNRFDECDDGSAEVKDVG